jgi:hypothetical protein
LNIYAKSQDDALQLVEQILPYFAPQYTLTIKPFADIDTLTEDVPITLSGVTFQDDFEGAVEQRRTIIYTLDFEMKIALYGPESNKSIIRDVRNNLFLKEAGLNDSDVYIKTMQITPNPTTVSADSDYGFINTDIDSSGKYMSDTSNDKNIKDDYTTSRDTYHDIIEKGRESMDLMIEVARESEHPRAFEVLSGMMKNMADVTDKLMDLNKKHKEINQTDEPKQIGGTTTNNLFVGTTTDLQRLIQNEKQVDTIIDVEPEQE